MARPQKSSVLVCLAILCQLATASPSRTREPCDDTSSSSSASVEGLQSDESSLTNPAFLPTGGRGDINMHWNDREAQREMARKFPGSTNPNRSRRFRARRRPMASRLSGSNIQPLPERPSFIPNGQGILTTVANNVRDVASVIHQIPAAVGASSSSVISQNVQAVLQAPVTLSSRPTRVSSSSSVVDPSQVQPSRSSDRQTTNRVNTSKPSRPRVAGQSSGNSQAAKLPFPGGQNIPVTSGFSNFGGSPSASPSQSNVNPPPAKFPTQIEMNVPTASGGVQPPPDFVPGNRYFIFENFAEVDPLNPANAHSGNGGILGVPANVGSSQQPSTGNSGTSNNYFPSQTSNNNFNQVPGFNYDESSFDQFDAQNTNKFDVAQSYPDISPVVDSIQKFTLDLLDTYRTGQQDTVIYSPVSISSLLSLLTLATDGHSRHEIEVALSLPTSSSGSDYHAQFQTLLERLNHHSQGITISTSSRLFLEQSMTIFGNFTRSAMNNYNCNVSLENFLNRPMQTMNRVNRWVKEETQGKITEFVSQPFSSNTVFVAANTIYFNGDWETPFPEYFTSERDFDTGNEVVKIPMMTNVFETPHYYSKDLDVDVTSLPYKGKEFAMIIILPRESPTERSIVNLERLLNPALIEGLVNNMTSKSVSVSLPKMKLSMKTSLVENLSELYIKSIFSPSSADFSRLSNKKPLWVSQFLHEALMEVTEVGTVAAAASAVSLDRIGGYQRINVNKPAIILIRDMITHVPLFWTRLVKPQRVPDSGQTQVPSPTKF